VPHATEFDHHFAEIIAFEFGQEIPLVVFLNVFPNVWVIASSPTNKHQGRGVLQPQLDMVSCLENENHEWWVFRNHRTVGGEFS